MGVAAALTPRVRIMVICDGVRESITEAGVFDLEGVRQSITVDNVPFAPPELWLFLVLSSPRSGRFPGYVRVINEANDKTVFHAHMEPVPVFDAGMGMLPVFTPIRCSFPEAGNYSVQVSFFQEHEHDVLKAEMPFSVTMGG